MRSDLPILVVGAGIGGLAAALALARIGYRVAVFEQANELKEIGAGIQLGPNAFRVFDLLGLEPAIAADAVFPDRYQMRDAFDGRDIFHVPLGEQCVRRFGYRYGVTHRHDLQRVLLDACRATGAIQIRLGCRIDHHDDDGREVEVRTASGGRIRGAALIGADGIRSRIRETLHAGIPDPISPGLLAGRAVLETDSVPEEFRAHRVTIWFGPRGHVIYYPLRAGRVLNFAAVCRRPEGEVDVLAHLAKVFEGHHPSVRALLSRCQAVPYAAATERTALREWGKGRVTLLGDAAHAMTQNLAQGGVMALEDAVVLADQLVAHDGAIEAAFRAYQDARYLRAARVQATARMYGDYCIHAAGAERDLRDALLAARDPLDSHEVLAWLFEGVRVRKETAAMLGRVAQLSRFS